MKSLPLILTAFMVLGSQSQLPSLSGPIAGYVFDNTTGRIHPVRGILGSGTVGDPVDMELEVSRALPLDAHHVLAVMKAGSDVVVLDLKSAPPAVGKVTGVPANPTHIVVSARGTAAAFYYADDSRIVVVTDLPANPNVFAYAGPVPVAGSLTHMAVSNDGGLLLFTLRIGEGEDLYRSTPSSPYPQFLVSAVSIGGMAITEGKDAIVADRGANEVFAIWNAGETAVPQFLAGAQNGVSNPTGVGVSSGNRIYVASSDSGNVMAFDSAGRLMGTLGCDCRLTGIHPFRDSMFRLTDGIDRTLFLLDAGSAKERIFFVPPRN